MITRLRWFRAFMFAFDIEAQGKNTKNGIYNNYRRLDHQHSYGGG
ncbi:MAG: hypothetical protein ACI8R4_002238 [Paracoccaceae bacterium]|jgi:hypothetical protein